MDDALAVLLDKGDEEDEDDALDLSPAGIERERRRWILTKPEHLDIYVLWRQMAGMGGETIGGLWALAQQPGTEALFRDFGTLHARERRLQRRAKRMKEGIKQ